MAGLTIPLAKGIPLIGSLGAELRRIQQQRQEDVDQIGDVIGSNPLALARVFVEPDVTNGNPMNYAETASEMALMDRSAGLSFFANFFDGSGAPSPRQGANQLFLLAGAGMGKTSLLGMLKLTHLVRFWQWGTVGELQCTLEKIGPKTLDNVRAHKAKQRTILLLDSLDEHSAAVGEGFHDYLKSLLHESREFHRVLITCRSQFFDQEVNPGDGLIQFGSFRCHRRYIAPFNEHQIEQYLDKVYPKRWRSFLGFDRDRREQRERAHNIVEFAGHLSSRPLVLSYLPDLLDLSTRDNFLEDHHEGAPFILIERIVERWLEREVIKLEEQHVKSGMTTDTLRQAAMLASIVMEMGPERRTLPPTQLEILKEVYPELFSYWIEDWRLEGRCLLNRNSSGEYRFEHYIIQECLQTMAAMTGSLRRWESEDRWPFDLAPVLHSSQTINFCFQLLHNKRLPLTELTWFNLRNVDLSEADLSGANLSGANLSGANLSNTKLSGTNLSRAKLSGAKLSGAQLNEAKLSGINLSRTNLSGVNLSGIKLSDANLSDTNLCGANLNETDLSGANLSGANLNEAMLSGANLLGADLSNSTLIRANLNEANLKTANLNEANLSNAGLIRVDLSDANLSGANLNNARLVRATLKGTNISGTNLVHASLERANLNKADLSNSTLIRANLNETDLSGANLSGANLNEAMLSGANLLGADLSNSTLIRANLSKADVSEADLRGAGLSEANLANATMVKANLNRAGLNEADLRGADLTNATSVSANLNGANLSGANLSGANLTNATLIRANLNGAGLYEADLRGADLTNATYDQYTMNLLHFSGQLYMRK